MRRWMRPILLAAFQSFYRRPLPAQQIALASAEGKKIFREALNAGGMGNYFELAEQFHTQNEPAYCAPGTLVMVLNALAIDPGRIWKGPWRWFSEEMLVSCVPLDYVKSEGITFEEFQCICQTNGAAATAYRADENDKSLFLSHIEQTVSQTSPVNTQLVMSYSRAGMGQTGDGHFSPLGGYHKQRDLCLIMDVARFKYPPHWAKLDEIWQAMLRKDKVTGRSRGWMLVSAEETHEHKEQCSLFRDHQHVVTWERVREFFAVTFPFALSDELGAGNRVRFANPMEQYIYASLLKTPMHIAKCFTVHMQNTVNLIPADQAEDMTELQVVVSKSQIHETVLSVFGLLPTAQRSALHSSPQLATCMLLLFPPLSLRSTLPPALLDCAKRITFLPDESRPFRSLVNRIRDRLHATTFACCVKDDGRPHNHKPACAELLRLELPPIAPVSQSRPSPPPAPAKTHRSEATSASVHGQIRTSGKGKPVEPHVHTSGCGHGHGGGSGTDPSTHRTQGVSSG